MFLVAAFIPLRRVFPGGYKCNKAQDGKLSWKLVFMYYTGRHITYVTIHLYLCIGELSLPVVC